MSGYRKYRRYNKQDAVSDKLRQMANQRIQSIEAVVARPETEHHLNDLYSDFVAWMNYKKVDSDEFRYLYKRYYNEFIGGL